MRNRLLQKARRISQRSNKPRQNDKPSTPAKLLFVIKEKQYIYMQTRRLYIKTYCLVRRVPFALFISKIVFIYEFINFLNHNFCSAAKLRKAATALCFQPMQKKSQPIVINNFS